MVPLVPLRAAETGALGCATWQLLSQQLAPRELVEEVEEEGRVGKQRECERDPILVPVRIPSAATRSTAPEAVTVADAVAADLACGWPTIRSLSCLPCTAQG